MPNPSNFGQHIRALRLGFRWCEPLQGLLRISASDAPFAVILSDAESLPTTLSKEHRLSWCWWESDVDELIAMSPALTARLGGPVKGRTELLLDDHGLTARVPL